MGSLPKGNLCAYCGVRRAGALCLGPLCPDGCIGALCIGPNDDDDGEGETCYEVGQRLGWDVVWERYTLRCYTAMARMLCQELPWPFQVLDEQQLPTSVSRFMYRAETIAPPDLYVPPEVWVWYGFAWTVDSAGMVWFRPVIELLDGDSSGAEAEADSSGAEAEASDSTWSLSALD